jgi:hypothetical protein
MKIHNGKPEKDVPPSKFEIGKSAQDTTSTKPAIEPIKINLSEYKPASLEKIESCLDFRNNLFSEAKAKGIERHVYDIKGEEDKAFPYVNNDLYDGPVQIASIVTEASYTYDAKKHETTSPMKSELIQIPIEGNNVSQVSTANAFLLNNNKKSIATIRVKLDENIKDDAEQKTAATKKLAHNTFLTANNIQEVIAPDIQGENGKVIATNTDGSGETHLLEVAAAKEDILKDPSIKKSSSRGYNDTDDILNQQEINDMFTAGGLETKSLVLKETKNSGEEERISAASTVNLDDNDPRFAFYEAAGKLDGKPGVTEDELAQAYDAITKLEGDKLKFNHEKLDSFLKNPFGYLYK